jgi:hypothetical protein
MVATESLIFRPMADYSPPALWGTLVRGCGAFPSWKAPLRHDALLSPTRARPSTTDQCASDCTTVTILCPLSRKCHHHRPCVCATPVTCQKECAMSAVALFQLRRTHTPYRGCAVRARNSLSPGERGPTVLVPGPVQGRGISCEYRVHVRGDPATLYLVLCTD